MYMLPRTNEKLDINGSISFQIIDWYIDETSKPYDVSTTYDIDMFGITETGKTVWCRVEKFEPYFYVKPPPKYSNKEDLKEFIEELQTSMLSVSATNKINKKVETFDTHEDFLEWKETIDEKEWLFYWKFIEYETIYNNVSYSKKAILPSLRNHFVSMKVVKRKDFWGYSNNELSYFILVKVRSLKLYRVLTNLFKSKYSKKGFILYESNIDPFLRFIHKKEIKPSGWVSINKPINNEIEGGCCYNIITNYENVFPIECNKTAPLLIASFDIECSSSHGDFPVATKDYKKLAEDLCSISVPLVEMCSENNKNINSVLKKWFIKLPNQSVNWGEYTLNQIYLKKQISVDKLSIAIDKCLDDVVKNMKLYDTTKTLSALDEIENNINAALTKHLPKLQGDTIIQIGTTFNTFGNSAICYKSLISLGTCDAIEGVNVKVVDTEKDLLLEWKKLFQKSNPDILTGFNIYGFDFKYMYDRCCELNIEEEFCLHLGRKRNTSSGFINKTVSSSAMGEVITSFFDIEGVLIIDVLYYCRKNMNLDSYKLDNIAEIFLGEKKNDLKPSELFSKFKGSSADRKIIAEYCIQDCALVNRLMAKLKIVENNIGMSNVCLVPLNYIFDRGQGVKIYSLVAYECMMRKQVIPVCSLFEDLEDNGYEGAIVLNPQSGIYIDDPIIVFDYSSLYPSSMIAENISHDTIIIDKNKYIDKNGKFINDDGNQFIKTIVYDGKECIFVKRADGIKGTIPLILEKLINKRKSTRKKIEYQTLFLEDDKFVSGLVKDKADNYIVTNVETNEVIEISKAAVKQKTDTYNSFEKAVFDALQLAYKITANSLYGQTGAKTSQIYMKDIAACTTATGRNMIVLAKDFVERNYECEVIYGDSVMPYTPLTILRDEGLVEVTTFNDFNDLDWTPYSQFKKVGTHKEQIFNPGFKVWTNNGWSSVVRLIRHKTVKKIYRVLTNSGLVDVTQDHSLLDNNLNIIKPTQCEKGQKLCHSKIKIGNNILKYIKHDGIYINKYGKIYLNDNKQNESQYIYLLLQNLGYYITISIENSKIVLIYEDRKITNEDNTRTCIQSIDVLYEDYEGFVYDVETSSGVFHAGVGEMIIKNTDSIFCKFNLYDENEERVYGKKAISYAIKKGLEVEKHIAEAELIKYKPQALNYEKVLSPLILFTKKRYAGQLYEFDANKSVTKFMGIAMKRRDSCRLVKDIFGDVMNEILLNHDINASFKVCHEWMDKLCNGDVPNEKLVISKALKSHYKKPESIAHKVLADRITSRDPGNKPAINDRLPYIFIKTAKDVKLQGDKIEHPDYIRENNLEIDYCYYITNQIMKPICQMYSLCLDMIPEYSEDKSYWNLIKQDYMEKAIYQNNELKLNTKLNELKERKVQELIFNKYITRLGGKITKPIAVSNRLSEPIPLRIIEKVIHQEPINITMKVSKKKIITTIFDNKETTIIEDIEKEKGVINELIKLCEKYSGYKIMICMDGYLDFVKKYTECKASLINTNEEVFIGDLKGLWIVNSLDKYLERLIIYRSSKKNNTKK